MTELLRNHNQVKLLIGKVERSTFWLILLFLNNYLTR